MKLVVEIIKPFKLDDGRTALSEVGVQDMTMSEVKGLGLQNGHTELYRGADDVVDVLPKVKLEVAVESSMLDRVVETITNAAMTGKVGNGKLFVYNYEQIVRVRTGEQYADAIGSRAPGETGHGGTAENSTFAESRGE